MLKMARKWSELANRNADNRKDAWISRIQILARRGSVSIYCSHITYFALRIVTKSNNIIFYDAWVPFESDTNLGYFLVLVAQVGSIKLFSFFIYMSKLVSVALRFQIFTAMSMKTRVFWNAAFVVW